MTQPASDSLDVPNCPIDLFPMIVAGTDEKPHWECPECGFVRIS